MLTLIEKELFYQSFDKYHKLYPNCNRLSNFINSHEIMGKYLTSESNFLNQFNNYLSMHNKQLNDLDRLNIHNVDKELIKEIINFMDPINFNLETRLKRIEDYLEDNTPYINSLKNFIIEQNNYHSKQLEETLRLNK